MQLPITPSTIHLPTIHRSVSTMPETPREKPQQKAIVAPPVQQHKLFQTRLPTVQEEPLMTEARITDITNAPGENAQHATARQQTSSMAQRRADFGERLRTLTSQVSQLAESMQDVHKEADNIEKSVTKQSSETATRETTPSPEQQRVEYQYPFSSPIQQAASPRIEIQQAVSTQQASASPSREITQATETASSTENTPVTARSEVSPRRETLPRRLPPPPPRRSRRANIGIAPDRYYDLQQKHLAVEYEKRDRDIQRAVKRAQAGDQGGNNMTEGGG
ncbi:hypothetical protein N7530_010548 [Penicillium desertorum]|uniref:Uncharacterized protein n=1 Tax=Penicillium desertorum TaxID=1303715 RepID=A0A9W9WHL7_9EURO|nr:hypothetical protein N7530_010548 [Penicillium desertorum]